MKDLEKKVCRILSAHVYFVNKDKSSLVQKARLWKSKEDLNYLKELDQKYQNYTHVNINAEVLNLSEE